MATKTEPAIVSGNEQRAIAEFIEDKRGNLVDIEYTCLSCADEELAALPWPGYEFPDYSVNCSKCHELINSR